MTIDHSSALPIVRFSASSSTNIQIAWRLFVNTYGMIVSLMPNFFPL